MNLDETRALLIGVESTTIPPMSMKDIFCQDGAVAALQRAVCEAIKGPMQEIHE